MGGRDARGSATAGEGGPTPAIVAAEMLDRVPELADGCTSYLVASVPELSDAENLYWEETRASTAAHLDQIARLIRAEGEPDELVVPVETARWVRGLVQRGIGLPVLLRAFRLGHAWLWERWSQALHARIPDADARTAIGDALSAFLFRYVDRISDVLVESYGSERERAMRSSRQQRAETVRAILAHEPVDEETASRRLGYDLRRHHVALRITSTGDAAHELERTARAAARAAGLSEPLLVAAGMACVDVWVGAFDRPDRQLVDRLESFEPPADIAVAVGDVGHGVGGFRASHEQAVQAARIAVLAGPRSGPVTTHRRIELVSLLAADLPRAGAFAARCLGALGAPSAAAQRLRETVLLFLTLNGSASRTAERLFIHPNTVAYRVRRAEELLGRPVTDQPTELACALMLVDVLGASL